MSTIDGYTTRVIGGKELLFDDEGYLVNPEDWTEGLAEVIARDIGIEQLSDPQWMVIRFVRDFYLENGRAPLNRDLRRATGMSLMDIEGLFPDGIRRGARRIAGLPNPKTC